MGRGSGRVRRGGRTLSVWWKYLYDIVEGEGGGVASWFYEGVLCEVDNGENTSFWCDPWLNGGVLRSRVSRLFDLCVDSSVTITENKRLGWEVDGGDWRWRMRLFAWEKELLAEVLDCSIMFFFFAG